MISERLSGKLSVRRGTVTGDVNTSAGGGVQAQRVSYRSVVQCDFLSQEVSQPGKQM